MSTGPSPMTRSLFAVAGVGGVSEILNASPMRKIAGTFARDIAEQGPERRVGRFIAQTAETMALLSIPRAHIFSPSGDCLVRQLRKAQENTAT